MKLCALAKVAAETTLSIEARLRTAWAREWKEGRQTGQLGREREGEKSKKKKRRIKTCIIFLGVNNTVLLDTQLSALPTSGKP